MRRYIFIVIISCFTTSCLSQSKTKSVWLPEKHIESTLDSDTINSKYLIPLEGIVGSLDNCYILTYKGELTPVELKQVYIDGKIKYQLFNLHYYMNLKYNSKNEVEAYSKAKIYFSKIGKKILMEIIWDKKKKDIYFIDRYNDYIFTKISEAKKHLKNR